MQQTPNSIGIDECGRGSIAFNVVAAAVVLPDVSSLEDDTWKQIRDSKKLSAKKRAALSEYIKGIAVSYGIGEATPEEIDEHNILQATMMAMHRACDRLHEKLHDTSPNHIYVDGTYFRKYKTVPHTCVIKGDDTYLNIAAASILAKAHHDATVQSLLSANPDLEKYGVGTNMGYGTSKHLEAVKTYGITEHHRKSFLTKYI